jgi:trimeric autotransporter adhesin
MTRSTLRAIGAAVLCAALTACGGESVPTVPTVATTAPTTTQLTVRGTVSGLLGQDLELTLNGAIPIAASGNGSFQYSATVPVGTTVSVAVTRQPVAPAQVCRAATPTRAADGAWVVSVDCDAPPNGTAGALTGSLAVKQLTLSWSAAADATSYQVQRRTGDGTWVDDGQPIAAPTTSTVLALSVHLVDWVTARYRVAVCNARGCNATTTELSVLDTIAGAIGYLKASNTDAGDRFGAAIAMSADGSTLAVAAVEEDGNGTGATGNPADNTVANAGAVYVYLRGATGWTQQAYLKASNPGAGDGFGVALSLSANGSTLAVGAPGEDSSTTTINSVSNNSASDAGAAYVFTRTGTTWTQQAYVKASNAGADDGFGTSVTLSADGSTLAVGAPGEDSSTTGVIATAPSVNNSAANAGAAYVFGRSGTTWTQQAYVKASNTDAGDEFGRSLALSGDGGTLAVGAPNESSAATGVNGNASDNSAAASGAVYVFVRPATSWSQQAYLKASNTGGDDLLGQSLALSQDGNTLAVGAPFEDSVGAPSDDTASGSGAVYVFVRSGVTWSQQAYLKATATFAGDAFGTSVALAADGNTLAIGAPLGDGSTPGTGNPTTRGVVDTGAVTVFVRGGATWAARSYLQASHIGASDQFGMTVALSGDGTLLAVGAPLEDSAATGYGGDATNASAPDAGGVFLY